MTYIDWALNTRSRANHNSNVGGCPQPRPSAGEQGPFGAHLQSRPDPFDNSENPMVTVRLFADGTKSFVTEITHVDKYMPNHSVQYEV